MKKAAIIFLLLIYVSSSLGLAVKAGYCCGKLVSFKLVLANESKDKEACCKVKFQSLKVNDVHAAADIVATPALHFTFLHTLNTCFEASDLAYQQHNGFINIHAPPLSSSVPTYISNCVFRI